MKRKAVLILASILVLSMTGCGEPLMLEDAREEAQDTSAADSGAGDSVTAESSQDTPGQTSAGAAAIMEQLGHDSTGEADQAAADETQGDVYTANLVASTNTDVHDLIPYEARELDPDRDEETDTIQLRINEDSRDHSIASLRFWIDGTITDFICDAEEYDMFRGAYVCDLNFTDNLSNVITVFTSSQTGRHKTTIYSFVNDKMYENGSYGGFIDFMSIDGAGEFTITEATNIQTPAYGTMYVRKNFRTNEVYDYDVRDSIQELIIDSNSVGYYPEEGHFAIGYPFSLKSELTLYVNGEENYMTGKLPVNFRGLLMEAMLDENQEPNVFLVRPEDGWTDSETNIDSPLYAPSSAGSENFDPEDYTGWVAFTELGEVSNEGFYIDTQP